MENISATNCQYVQVLDLQQHLQQQQQGRPAHLNPHQHNPHPTYISHSNIVPAHLSFLNPSASASINTIAFPSSAPPPNMSPAVRQQYVQQTLQELMQKPKKSLSKGKTSGPYGRQAIPLETHSDLMRFNQNLLPGPSHHGLQGRSPRKKVADRILRSEDEYTVFIPKKSLVSQQFNAKVDCRGCGKVFNGAIVSMGTVFGEPDFFIHCVKECPKYRELGLIRKCDDCALLFINSQSERKHHGEMHRKKQRIRKPDWMSEQVYRVRSGIRCNTKVSCSACGQFFGAQNSAGKISYSLDYLIHCIQDCVEYHKLGLVQTCPTCNCKFLNRLSLSQHKLKSKH